VLKLPNILIVEDNADDYEATERSFRRAHFLNPIFWARNGQQAIDFLRNSATPVDLILLDLNMPGIDGRHVLERVKSDTTLKTIPIIVLTTSSDEKDIQACYALGASTFIQKPVNFEGLAEAIRTMNDYWFGIALLPETHEQKGDQA
jgi:two-component system, response regulator